jgi:hypothetical protein
MMACPAILAATRKGAVVPRSSAFLEEQGMAVLIALIALVLFSAIGLYMVFNATAEVRISDNYESLAQARYAALAGLDHARAAIKGLKYDDLLQGPDSAYDNSPTYMAQARTMGFRNLIDWSAARTLDILDPSSALTDVPDDGIINTGKSGSMQGTAIIPKAGIALTAPNPYGSYSITTARYFVKVTDNNGELSEKAKDQADNPFIDGDGIIIVRSMGVAQTLRETTGAIVRRNSVAVYEARLQMDAPFNNLSSPMIVIGDNVNATFHGNAFSITGGDNGPGIATIDINTSDPADPAAIIRTAANGKGSITGNCPPIKGKPDTSCIGDITAAISADFQLSKLKDPAWWYGFIYNSVPKFADNVWNGSDPVDLGTDANPKVTFVNGDLKLTGGITGAGLLVVTGNLELGGTLTWDGLVLAVGAGNLSTSGMNNGINGGVIVCKLTKVLGQPSFGDGAVTINISGNSDITAYDNLLLALANRLVPPKQLSIREVTSSLDK